MTNSADPDQLAISWLLQKPTYLDLHYFLTQGMSCLAREGLRGIDTLVWFPTIFYKGDNLCDFRCAIPQTNPFLKGSTLNGKNLLPRGVELPRAVDPFSEGRQNNFAVLRVFVYKYLGSVKEKVPSNMRKMWGFTSSCICAKSHLGSCSLMKHSIVSNDSVCGQRRP